MIDNLALDLEGLILSYARHASLEQRGVADRFLQLLSHGNDPFDRHSWGGHITASALITNPDRDHVLLIKHRKLGIWLQPGGHVEREHDQTILGAALREVREETGLQQVAPVGKGIFDLDIHTIPARGDVPEHLHYDVRFLVQSSLLQEVTRNEETTDIRWFPVREMFRPALDASQQRLAAKLIVRVQWERQTGRNRELLVG